MVVIEVVKRGRGALSRVLEHLGGNINNYYVSEEVGGGVGSGEGSGGNLETVVHVICLQMLVGWQQLDDCT